MRPVKEQDQSQIKWISDFIWNIADGRLRDVYVCGKYRDVILPFTVLRMAAGQAFYNVSEFTLATLKASADG
jgi:type I restriction enzyme M protein